MHSRVSLAELIDSDVAIRPDEAVAILREVCRQYAQGALRGIPNSTVIRLTAAGEVFVEGPVNPDQDPVRAAAALLGDLLPGFDTPTGFKVPGGLRLVLARASRAIDLPPFADVAEFCAALERFASADLPATVRRLYEACTSPAGAAPARETTISDIRRARRATGLSLDDVAQAAGVPAAKLRELEWGYMRNWRADDESRDALGRYARAAGLDGQLVASVAWPLIESAADDFAAIDRHRDLEPAMVAGPPPVATETWALVPKASATLVRFASPAPPGRVRGVLARHRRAAIAIAAALLLAVLSIVIWSQQPHSSAVMADAAPPPTDERPVPVAATEAVPTPRRAATTREDARAPEARPASYLRAAPATHPRVTKSRRKAAPAHKSFFKRELFRIVIK